mmetsp:Transcript_20754/g.29745  ORF Transcript_20754/g.29745 Transcript_20754/m.29745 type:complete len:232 (-) Transcript_20754:258-953(-)
MQRYSFTKKSGTQCTFQVVRNFRHVDIHSHVALTFTSQPFHTHSTGIENLISSVFILHHHFVGGVDSFEVVHCEDGVFRYVHQSDVGVVAGISQSRAKLHLVSFLSTTTARIVVGSIAAASSMLMVMRWLVMLGIYHLAGGRYVRGESRPSDRSPFSGRNCSFQCSPIFLCNKFENVVIIFILSCRWFIHTICRFFGFNWHLDSIRLIGSIEFCMRSMWLGFSSFQTANQT